MFESLVKRGGLLILVGIVFPISAQFKNDQHRQEAQEMLALCNSFTFLDLYGSDEEIIPEGYDKVYTSEVMGMDNIFQVYLKGGTAVFNFRGSTEKMVSWMENSYSAMIPAQGTIRVDEADFNYVVAEDTGAGVHSGYMLALSFLAEDVRNNVRALNDMQIQDIVFTGHSQGGALALLFRAYMEHLPEDSLLVENQFRTYAFAHPKVGNEGFMNEFETNFCSDGMCYSIVNPADKIPKLPFTYHEDRIAGSGRVKRALLEKDESLASVSKDMFVRTFSGTIKRKVNNSSNSIHKNLEKEFGTIELPPRREGVNYAVLPGRIELEPFSYPKILIETGEVLEDEIVIGLDGVEENDELYKKEPGMYQHKPYNYYVGFLKQFDPDAYQALEQTYLPENL